MTDNPPRVLIIENDFLIGEMLHDMVAELGYSVTKVAHGLPSALNEISKENFDGALVNIGIDDQKHGNDIADILLAKNIPFAFVTGYGHAFEQRHARHSTAAEAIHQRAAARPAGSDRRAGRESEPLHLARGLAQVAHLPLSLRRGPAIYNRRHGSGSNTRA